MFGRNCRTEARACGEGEHDKLRRGVVVGDVGGLTTVATLAVAAAVVGLVAFLVVAHDQRPHRALADVSSHSPSRKGRGGRGRAHWMQATTAIQPVPHEGRRLFLNGQNRGGACRRTIWPDVRFPISCCMSNLHGHGRTLGAPRRRGLEGRWGWDVTDGSPSVGRPAGGAVVRLTVGGCRTSDGVDDAGRDGAAD